MELKAEFQVELQNKLQKLKPIKNPLTNQRVFLVRGLTTVRALDPQLVLKRHLAEVIFFADVHAVVAQDRISRGNVKV